MTLDHAFVLVRPWIAGQSGAEAADEIVDAFEAAGFRSSPGRRHPGQGTENRPFRFGNFMLELLFVVDRDEAGDPRTAPLALLPRIDDAGTSPFGIASRPDEPDALETPWPSTAYHPIYLPPDTGIAVARDVPPTEPLWFHLPFVMPDGSASARAPVPGHPNGIDRLETLTLIAPAPFGTRSAGIAEDLGVAVEHDPRTEPRTVLRFGSGEQGLRLEPHARLPLTIHA